MGIDFSELKLFIDYATNKFIDYATYSDYAEYLLCENNTRKLYIYMEYHGNAG